MIPAAQSMPHALPVLQPYMLPRSPPPPSPPPSPVAQPAPVPDVNVHLLAWTGAQTRHVEKYADMWRSLPGSPTTTIEAEHCRMGVTENWSTDRFDTIADDLFDRLLAAPPSQKNILHVFSNGGGTLWTALSRKIHETNVEKRPRLDGLIFDSCPGSMRSLRSGFNFLWESQRSPIARAGLVAASPCLAVITGLGILSTIRFADGQFTDYQARYVHDLLLYAQDRAADGGPSKLPVLYLYSADDKLIAPHDVEAVMKLHEQSGACDVMAKRWEHSPHVRHLETDRIGYVAACEQVLSKL